MTTRIDTIIIGGGQAGLAAAYHLKKREIEFLVLESNARVGDSWRNRWDSLRLFTPARFSKLPGLAIPGRQAAFPTKDEMGDYLEQYAERFEIPVRTGVRVETLTKRNGGYVIETSQGTFEASNVIVATGAHRTPKTPTFSSKLGRSIVQLHSSDYKSPAQLRKGAVLVVGLGNSGAEIAFEVAKTHPTYVAGKPSAQLPFKHNENMGRFIFPIIRFVGYRVLTLSTPMGRKVRPKFLKLAAPLIRVKTKHLAKAGAEQVARVAASKDGRPVLEDERVLDVSNVIWCTGFKDAYDWIDIDVFDEDGRPVHDRGVVETSPGLYFMGLVFQYAVASDVLPGVGRDGAYVAKHIAKNRSGTGTSVAARV